MDRFLAAQAGHNIRVISVRCDNAGEHQDEMHNACARYSTTIKYTAPYTPDFNRVVERKFATIGQRAHAMMRASGIDQGSFGRLWAEAVMTATHLHNCSYLSGEIVSPYNKHPAPSPSERQPIQFGRVGYVKTAKKLHAKFKEKRTRMHMVGYALLQPSDTYRMWNPKTQKVVMSQDINWEP